MGCGEVGHARLDLIMEFTARVRTRGIVSLSKSSLEVQGGVKTHAIIIFSKFINMFSNMGDANE